MDTTEHDLKLLSIGYYIQGALITSYALLMLAYIAFIGALLSVAQRHGDETGRQLPPGAVAFIEGLLASITIFALACGIALIYAGWALRKYKHRMFIFVMAALGCLAIPYGTVLSIFTFMVLQRPTAKALFSGAPSPSALPDYTGS